MGADCGDRERASASRQIRTFIQEHLLRVARRLSQEKLSGPSFAEAPARHDAAVSGPTRMSPALASALDHDDAAPGGAYPAAFRDGTCPPRREVPRMHTLRHPQRHLRAGHLDAADVATRGASGPRLDMPAPHGLGRGTTAEASRHRTLGGGPALRREPQDRLEAGSDRVGDPVPSLAALARQPFGKLREPGDVDECRGAFGCSPLAGGSASSRCWRIRGMYGLNGPRRMQIRVRNARAVCVVDHRLRERATVLVDSSVSSSSLRTSLRSHATNASTVSRGRWTRRRRCRTAESRHRSRPNGAIRSLVTEVAREVRPLPDRDAMAFQRRMNDLVVV